MPSRRPELNAQAVEGTRRVTERAGAGRFLWRDFVSVEDFSARFESRADKKTGHRSARCINRDSRLVRRSEIERCGTLTVEPAADERRGAVGSVRRLIQRVFTGPAVDTAA